MAAIAGGVLALGCRSDSLHSPHSGSEKNAARTEVRSGPDGPKDRIAEAHAHYAAGVIHDLNDENQAALDEYYKAALNDPGDETLVLEVSRRFLQEKQPQKALEIVQRAVARPHAGGRVFARLGLIYMQMGRADLAKEAERRSIKEAPQTLAGYQGLFLTSLQAGQEQQCLQVLGEAERQPGTDAEFLIGLAELYANFNLQYPSQKQLVHAHALAILERAEKQVPADPLLQLKLADGFSSVGLPSKAAQLYLGLLKTLPQDAPVREQLHAKLADIYLRSSNQTEAVAQLEAILREDPTNPQAYYWLGCIAMDQHEEAKAVDFFHKTLLLSPGFEPAYYDLATTQLNANKTSDALATLNLARQKFSPNFVLEYLTGLAYSRDKAYAQALEHLCAAELIAGTSDPSRLDEHFYFQLGSAYERKGDLEQAEKYFVKCLKLAPDFDEAQNYLGYMWAEHGIKLEQALELISKALKAEPRNAAYLDSMGWVLYKLKRPTEALPYELQAVEHSEEPDPTVFDHLGDIYQAANQPQKAQEAWRKSLLLEDDEQVRKKLLPVSHP